MQTLNLNRWTKTLRDLGLASVLAASSAGAAVVWDLNPNDQTGPVGSATRVFTSETFQITASGYDNNGTPNAPRELFFKNEAPFGGATETGLGLVGTGSNELNAGPGAPLNYIQLDLRAILSLDFINGQIKVGSLQDGEGFQLFGSDVQGTLGTAIGGPFTGLAFDDLFVTIPQFGAFDFVSIAAATGNVLPVAFAASPIPEMGTVMPILGLLAAVASTSLLRRRRAAKMAG